MHPVAVADLLRDIGASASVIAAGFLHDVVEDTDVTPEQLESHFGPEVRGLVEGVTKLGGLHFTNRTEAQAENLRKMFLAMASDIRVVLVKLADRLHNMRTLGALREKRQRIAQKPVRSMPLWRIAWGSDVSVGTRGSLLQIARARGLPGDAAGGGHQAQRAGGASGDRSVAS